MGFNFILFVAFSIVLFISSFYFGYYTNKKIYDRTLLRINDIRHFSKKAEERALLVEDIAKSKKEEHIVQNPEDKPTIKTIIINRGETIPTLSEELYKKYMCDEKFLDLKINYKEFKFSFAHMDNEVFVSKNNFFSSKQLENFLIVHMCSKIDANGRPCGKIFFECKITITMYDSPPKKEILWREVKYLVEQPDLSKITNEDLVNHFKSNPIKYIEFKKAMIDSLGDLQELK